ncbi:MAG: mechanosensitive ion channel [Flavipsychrobacter sp.]
MESNDAIREILYNPMIQKGVAVFVGVAIIWGIIKLLQKNLASRIKNNEARYKTRKLTSFIGFLLTALLVTIVFSERLGGLTVAIGVAGAGIAFALQEVIVSVAGWMAIIFGNFYKTGDRVQLGGIKGDVIDIGVLRTTIMETGEWVDGDLYNGRIVLVANSFVFKEPVFNYSGDFGFLWDELKLPVQFSSNFDKARSMLLAIAKEAVGEYTVGANKEWEAMLRKYRIENAKTEPQVSLAIIDGGAVFTLRYVVDFKLRRSIKDKIYSRILEQVKTADDIFLPASTIQITDAPDINVKIKE